MRVCRSVGQPVTQVVDLKDVLRGLRRRGQVVLAMVLIGVVGAGIFVALSPTTYVATARVVLPPSPVDAQGHDLRDINSEVQIVRGAAVLGPTTKVVVPPIELSVLQHAVSVRHISSRIIEIAGRASNGDRAAQLANAVAVSYVAFADDTATADANATAAAYGQEVDQLNQHVQQLQQQIASSVAALAGLGPAETQRREAVIDTLRSEQSVLAQQLNTDQSRIADARLQAQLSRQGTQVLQPALRPTRPSSPKPFVDLALGAVAGALIGGIAALALENGDQRLRTRDGLSEAVGAPVAASLAVGGMDRPERCRAFLENWEPSVVESYALRQAFARLESACPGMENLVLVGLAGDTEAGAVALELAAFTAMGGTPTALVFASNDDTGARLRAGCAAATAGPLDPRPGLAILGTMGGVDPDRLDGAGLVITFVVADSGPILLPTWDRSTVVAMVVSAGRSTAQRLEAVAAACLDAGAAVSALFVANPDPSDRSTGQRAGRTAVNGTSWGVADHAGRSSADGDREKVHGGATSESPPGNVSAANAVATQSRPASTDAGPPTEKGLPG